MEQSSETKPRERRTPGTLGDIRMFGVPVRFHFTFVLVLALIVAAGLRGKSMAVDALFLTALFLSVLLHELGHALVARFHGVRTIEIVMLPIGGIARMERQLDPKAEFWIALAGPAVNFVLSGAGLAAVAWGRIDDLAARELIQRIAAGNLYIGGVNLLPAFPMDGGRVLRAVLALWKGEQFATRTATNLGRILAILAAVYGIMNGYVFLLIVAFLIYMAASQEGAASTGRALTRGVPVRAAMVTDFKTLHHGSTLREAAQLLIATSQQDFPVMHGDEMIGLLDRTSFLRGMALEGADAYVSSFMERNYLRIAPDAELADTLPAVAESGSCGVVFDGQRVIGLLTQENISEFLLLRRMGLSPAGAAD